MPISRKYGALFVHIPKTAGTSIEKMLEIPEGEESLLVPDANVGRPALQHLAPRDAYARLRTSRQEWDALYKFTVVREPFARAVSGYAFLRAVLVDNGHLSGCAELEGMRRALRGGFGAFVDFAVAEVERLREQGDEASFDDVPFYHHLRPQSHFFDDALPYDAIFRFEDVPTRLEPALLAAVGCANPLPLLNHRSSIAGGNSSDGDVTGRDRNRDHVAAVHRRGYAADYDLYAVQKGC